MKKIYLLLGAMFVFLVIFAGCFLDNKTPQSTSGVKKVEVRIKPGADGLTAEQRNVGKRMTEDNLPGAIKHLYVISAYSGQVIIYSTVDTKVTSSGKRLTPETVESAGETEDGFPLTVGVWHGYTTEVLGDDGTYGPSVPYIYWWDTKGVYHQHYVSGGQILHISGQPLAVKSIIINMEVTQKAEAGE